LLAIDWQTCNSCTRRKLLFVWINLQNELR
jgi:hypothetical protein